MFPDPVNVFDLEKEWKILERGFPNISAVEQDPTTSVAEAVSLSVAETTATPAAEHSTAAEPSDPAEFFDTTEPTAPGTPLLWDATTSLPNQVDLLRPTRYGLVRQVVKRRTGNKHDVYYHNWKSSMQQIRSPSDAALYSKTNFFCIIMHQN